MTNGKGLESIITVLIVVSQLKEYVTAKIR